MANMIVGIKTNENQFYFEKKFEETIQLCKALDLEMDYEMTQNLEDVNQLSYIGKGKVEELIEFVKMYEIETIVFNDELTSNQYNFLAEAIGVTILDRTSLILAIFEQRARTKEAVLQVKIAKLKYQLPRLTGSHQDIFGQLGGSGFRGAGETQLELDRRQLYNELHRLESELKKVVVQRKTQRQKRKAGDLPVVALVGYTNSGKSTLMNTFLKRAHHDTKSVFEKDMLFATLSTNTRYIKVDGYYPFLLTDTVGFISHLPHSLIKAFRSTLEEIKEADLLIQVVDASDPECENHIETTNQVLEELGAKDIPMLYAYNKVDLGGYAFIQTKEPHIFISAKNGTNIDAIDRYIRKTLYPHVKRVQLMIPYDQGELYSYLSSHCQIISESFEDQAIYLVVEVLPNDYKKVENYLIQN